MITHISRFPLLLPAALLAFSGVPGWAQQTPSAQTPSIANGPQILDVQGGKIRVVPLATGLYHPWGLAFPDARTILVSERNGKLRIIRDNVLLADPVWTSPTASGTSTGDALHFIAL